MRSPFRAKHHVVVQYMARWVKCPLPPPPTPLPSPCPAPSPSPCQTPTRPPPPTGPPYGEDKEDKEESTTLPAQATSHCSCLEHCFLFLTGRNLAICPHVLVHCRKKLRKLDEFDRMVLVGHFSTPNILPKMNKLRREKLKFHPTLLFDENLNAFFPTHFCCIVGDRIKNSHNMTSLIKRPFGCICRG